MNPMAFLFEFSISS